MNRDRVIQIIAALVALAAMAASTALTPHIAAEAGRAQLAYTAEAAEGDPPEVALGVAMGAFKGLFVNILWMRAQSLKQEGKFYDAIEVARTITKLTPRFPRVWSFHGWNLAYNISVATQTPEERWQWVQSGIRLLRSEGIPKNPNAMILYKELAWIFVHKIQGFTDDANQYYKRQVARDWTFVMGPPPEDPQPGDPDVQELYQRRISGGAEPELPAASPNARPPSDAASRSSPRSRAPPPPDEPSTRRARKPPSSPPESTRRPASSSASISSASSSSSAPRSLPARARRPGPDLPQRGPAQPHHRGAPPGRALPPGLAPRSRPHPQAPARRRVQHGAPADDALHRGVRPPRLATPRLPRPLLGRHRRREGLHSGRSTSRTSTSPTPTASSSTPSRSSSAGATSSTTSSPAPTSPCTTSTSSTSTARPSSSSRNAPPASTTRTAPTPSTRPATRTTSATSSASTTAWARHRARPALLREAPHLGLASTSTDRPSARTSSSPSPSSSGNQPQDRMTSPRSSSRR